MRDKHSEMIELKDRGSRRKSIKPEFKSVKLLKIRLSSKKKTT
jgi:hypothetical protein